MQPERFELRADPEGLAAQLRARVPAPTSVHEAVAEIITGVRQGGDEALIAYTRRFDTAGTEPGPLQVSDDELDRAARALSSDVRRGLEQAVENVFQHGGIAHEQVCDLPGIMFEPGNVLARQVEDAPDIGLLLGRHPEHALEHGEFFFGDDAVGARHAEIVKKARDAHVERGRSVANGVVGNGAGDERLADARRTNDHHLVVIAHPG